MSLYRRHTRDCPFFGKPRHARGGRNCSEHCPIWVQGSLRGEYVRRSLNLTSWEAASNLVLSWNASGTIGETKPDVPTIREAVEKFFADAAARKLSASTIQKQKNVLEKRLLHRTEKNGLRLLKGLDVDAVRRFRATWPDAPITAVRNLERLRNFFSFCRGSGWISTNPATVVRPPKVKPSPTLPFEPEDFERMLAGCDQLSRRGPYREGNRTRLKAMLLLLRYSGLRIRDAATLERSRVKDGKLFLYTQKTGTPVRLPLPPVVLEALEQTPVVSHKYFFWSGVGDPKSTVADWQRSLRRLLQLVGIQGHFHMLRDTAAVGWLMNGIPIEAVSILLGHSSVSVTEKHYSPWVKQRQVQLEEAVISSWT